MANIGGTPLIAKENTIVWFKMPLTQTDRPTTSKADKVSDILPKNVNRLVCREALDAAAMC